MTTSPKRYINPYKLFYGAFIPNWLLRRAEISQGAKLVYARMCQYAGEKGECFPNQDVLAREIGLLHSRQARRHIKELEQSQLIEVQRLGKQCSNRYLFLEHEWMSDRTSTSAHSDTSDRTNRPFTNCSDRTELSSGDRTSTSGLIERESIRRESITIPTFDNFWKLYPDRNGKKLLKEDARKEFDRITKSASPDLILQAVRNYKVSKTVTDGYVRDAVRFLKKDYWQDWLTPEAKSVESKTNSKKKEDDEEQVKDVAGNPLKDL